MTVSEVLAQYWADRTLRTTRTEQTNLRAALLVVDALFSALPVERFGAAELEAVRDLLTDVALVPGACRLLPTLRRRRGRLGLRTVNCRLNRIKAAFRWAARRRLIPAEAWAGLSIVEGHTRTGGPGQPSPPRKVRPAAGKHVRAVLPFVSSRTVRAMVLVQMNTGMRSGELCMMQVGDLDRSDPTCWVYRPRRHKTAGLGEEKVVGLGRRSQKAIARLVAGRPPGAFVFSPQRAVQETGGMGRYLPSRPREHYTCDTYGRAVDRAVRRAIAAGKLAAADRWTPHQLRHQAGTVVRRKYGRDAAQVFLGHRRPEATDIYAEPPWGLAIDVAREIG